MKAGCWHTREQIHHSFQFCLNIQTYSKCEIALFKINFFLFISLKCNDKRDELKFVKSQLNSSLPSICECSGFEAKNYFERCQLVENLIMKQYVRVIDMTCTMQPHTTLYIVYKSFKSIYVIVPITPLKPRHMIIIIHYPHCFWLAGK